MNTFTLLLRRRRVWFGAVTLGTIALLALALYLQHQVGLDPCPLCILQRYIYMVVAAFALLATLIPHRASSTLLGVLACLAAAAGAGVSGWHTYLQHYPPQIASCGPGLETLITNFPLSRALPKIFQGSGDCTKVDWTLLHLSIAEWSLVCFIATLIALVIGLRRPR